jgi:putative cardiolipin synthase
MQAITKAGRQPPMSGSPAASWLRAGAGTLLLALAAGCASLPPMDGRLESFALPVARGAPLARAVVPAVEQHPGKSGVVAIDDGRVSLGVRLALIREATRSVDIQTFIWHEDSAGTLLYDAVLRAAERGVRVRLLLDDLNAEGRDPLFALLASNPNLELRLYNPFVGRGSRAAGYLTDFERLNHRMHNKSFTIDSVVTVVGGRNLADEYFETGKELGLVDLDVVAIGQAVADVEKEFDLFWNSASAYPSRMIIAATQPMARDTLAQRVKAIADNPITARYAQAAAETDLVQRLRAGTLMPEWTTTKLVHDDPAKTLSPSDATEYQLLPRLEAAFGRPGKSLHLVSPYFVPGEAGTEALARLAERGVHVRVLTNSLAANDVKSVHIGYAKRRPRLLRGGVQIYELKPEASPIVRRAGEVGSGAKAGLHAKTYAVDGRAIFVGSFNLDPRSSKLNTEMGFGHREPDAGCAVGGGGRWRLPRCGLPGHARRRREDAVGGWDGQGVRRRSGDELGHESVHRHRLTLSGRLASVTDRDCKLADSGQPAPILPAPCRSAPLPQQPITRTIIKLSALVRSPVTHC